jgi:hypothetical protein
VIRGEVPTGRLVCQSCPLAGRGCGLCPVSPQGRDLWAFALTRMTFAVLLLAMLAYLVSLAFR